MIAMLRGRPETPGFVVWRLSAGRARATSAPAASVADRAGFARTRSRIQPHTRDSPWLRWRSRLTNGTRAFSTLSPSLESTAGRTVIEPSMATATTRIVPTANELNTALPAKNIPAMAIITVRPETSTARPEVAAANSSASAWERPASVSSILRRT